MNALNTIRLFLKNVAAKSILVDKGGNSSRSAAVCRKDNPVTRSNYLTELKKKEGTRYRQLVRHTA